MSLVRLLTTGKSLVGLKESENRYRLTSQRLLPKFEPKKNPFGSGTVTISEPAAEPGHSDSNPQAEAPAAADVQVQTVPAVSEKPAGAAKPEDPRVGLFAKVRSGCAARLRGLFRLPRALPVPAIARRQQSKKLFQAELSLEAVKVVRNDLSDTDVEIVTCKRAVDPKTNPATADAANESGSSRPWSKVTDTLFGGAKR